jgi:hypothetical protein
MGRPTDPLTPAESTEFIRLLRRVRAGVDGETYARKGSTPILRDEIGKAPEQLRQQIVDSVGEGERVRSVETIDAGTVDVTKDRHERITERHTLDRIQVGATSIDETEL